ncbi:unnamed protein product [Penicillium pancosmium]
MGIDAVARTVVDTSLLRNGIKDREHIDLEKSFVLPPEEIVEAIISLVASSKYPSDSIDDVGNIGGWREIGLLNDPGPQRQLALRRPKAKSAIKLVEQALADDVK